MPTPSLLLCVGGKICLGLYLPRGLLWLRRGSPQGCTLCLTSLFPCSSLLPWSLKRALDLIHSAVLPSWRHCRGPWFHTHSADPGLSLASPAFPPHSGHSPRRMWSHHILICPQTKAQFPHLEGGCKNFRSLTVLPLTRRHQKFMDKQ